MGATVHSLTSRPRPFMARYGISRCLGRGPIDAVYEGVNRVTGEKVAIRRTHPHLVDERVTKHVVGNARNATSVRHENVVAVKEIVHLEGDLFIVTQYVEGASLARLARRPLPLRIAMRIALDACAGLAAIHAARGMDGTRLVHGDVSPANIIVGADGITRLADFGVSKHHEVVDDAAPLRPGKCGYMAPEYILTGRHRADADVFAIGIVLWELFAGQRLFSDPTDGDVLHRALFEDAPSLIGFGVAREIASVVTRATARPAGYRYACASELEVELEDVAGEEVASHAEVAIFVAALVEAEEAEAEEPTRILNIKPVLAEATYEEQSARTG